MPGAGLFPQITRIEQKDSCCLSQKGKRTHTGGKCQNHAAVDTQPTCHHGLAQHLHRWVPMARYMTLLKPMNVHGCAQTDRQLSRETKTDVQASVFTVLCTQIDTERCLGARSESWLDKGLDVE